MHPLVRIGLILIGIGAISLWSVWTSSNSWLTFIFGFGGILMIVLGLLTLSAWAEQKEKERLSDEYDPNFQYNKKKYALLCNASYVGIFIAMISIMFTWNRFYSLGSKWWFVIIFGGGALVISYFLVYVFLLRRTPEMRVALKETGTMVFFWWLIVGAVFYHAFLHLNFETARKSSAYQRTFYITEVTDKVEKFETLKVLIEGEEVKCSPPLDQLQFLLAGDSAVVSVKKGILGFEHFLNFKPKKQ